MLLFQIHYFLIRSKRKLQRKWDETNVLHFYKILNVVATLCVLAAQVYVCVFLYWCTAHITMQTLYMFPCSNSHVIRQHFLLELFF